MSQYDPTLSVLGIPDHNIKVAFVRHEYRGNGVRRRQYHVIDAELTYRLTRCPLCGFEALHPNGFYTAHVRVLNGVEIPTVIDLHKQRWRCHNCYHTVSAKTPLVQPNHTIAAHMTERIMKLAHERLPVKTIARIIGIWQECQWSGQKLYGSAECVWLSLKFTHYQIFYQRLILFNVP